MNNKTKVIRMIISILTLMVFAIVLFLLIKQEDIRFELEYRAGRQKAYFEMTDEEIAALPGMSESQIGVLLEGK